MIILPLDIVAAYAIEHRGRPWLSTQPGGLVAFADPQPRVAQKIDHRILIGWSPYM